MHYTHTLVFVLRAKAACNRVLTRSFLFANRPLAPCISGLLTWLVRYGVRWHLGAALGWRPSASLPESAHRYALLFIADLVTCSRFSLSNLPLFWRAISFDPYSENDRDKCPILLLMYLFNHTACHANS